MWTYNNELYHFGIKGMHWGVRRYQNADGSLTNKGKYAARVARGHSGPGRYLTKKRQLEGDKKDLEYLNKGGHLSVGLTKKRQAAYDARDKERLEKRIAKNETKISKKKEYHQSDEYKAKRAKAIKTGAVVAGTALAAYGTYKLAKYVKSTNGDIARKRGMEAMLKWQNSEKAREKASKAAERFNAQNEYIRRNIANTQPYLDPTKSVRSSYKYQHALAATINSRKSSIKGDRALYGSKAVEGRNAYKEAKTFVDNNHLYNATRGGMYGWNTYK